MKGYFSFPINKNRVIFLLFDCVVLFVSIALAYYIRYGIIYNILAEFPVEKVMTYFVLLLPQVGIAFYTTGLYERWGMVTFSRMFVRLVISLALVGMFNGLLFFFYQTVYIGRLVFTLQLLIFFILCTVVKFFLILRFNTNGKKKDLLLVNFTRKEKKTFQDEVEITNAYNLVEFTYEREEDLSYFINRLDRHAIVVISSASKAVDRNIDMFISLKFNQFNIYDMKTFFSNITGKIPDNTFGEVWTIISLNEFVLGINSYYKIKRVLDIFLSLIHLVLLSPLFLVLSLLVKLSSRGPVLFRQERLGWNKKPFTLIKFRTMKVDAEKDGPQWASKNDPRVTLPGKFLRKTRMDEIPQLINILKGEMSFVGTRPIRQHFAEKLALEIPHYDLRFMIKPGLTGWSQVKFCYADSTQGQIEKFKYELYYLKNMSFMLDMIILVKTLRTVLGMNGH